MSLAELLLDNTRLRELVTLLRTKLWLRYAVKAQASYHDGVACLCGLKLKQLIRKGELTWIQFG